MFHYIVVNNGVLQKHGCRLVYSKPVPYLDRRRERHGVRSGRGARSPRTPSSNTRNKEKLLPYHIICFKDNLSNYDIVLSVDEGFLVPVQVFLFNLVREANRLQS